MTDLRQREPRQRDEKHLAYVRQQPCCLPFCNRQAEPAHLRMDNLSIGKELTGKGEKPHDRYTVPLCPYHHRTGVDCQHNNNERAWWELTGINPWAIAARLWVESGGAERAEQPRRAPWARKVKPRKPKEARRKIQSNPVIQSPGFGNQHRPFRPGEPRRAADELLAIELAEAEHAAEFVQVGDHDAERRCARRSFINTSSTISNRCRAIPAHGGFNHGYQEKGSCGRGDSASGYFDQGLRQ